MGRNSLLSLRLRTAGPRIAAQDADAVAPTIAALVYAAAGRSATARVGQFTIANSVGRDIHRPNFTARHLRSTVMISSFTSNKSTFELENLATYNGTAGSLWVEWLQKTGGRVFNGRAFVPGSRPTRKDVETSFWYFSLRSLFDTIKGK